MGEGMGTFVRLDQPLKLMNSCVISFGDSHMIINLENNLLTLRFIEGPKVDHKSYFSFRTFSPEDSPIKIGRMNDCDIRFDDNDMFLTELIVVETFIGEFRKSFDFVLIGV